MKLKSTIKNTIFTSFITLTLLGCGGGGGSGTNQTSTNIQNTTTNSTSTNPTTQSTCNIIKISDDTNFTDSYPSDIPWSGSSQTVEDIARVFNNARAQDSTISQELVMPSQSTWDNMSIQQRGMYLLNNERYYRGIKPYEGISSKVSDISQAYANILYNTDTFGHMEDGTPWDRLDRNSNILNNKDFFSYAENLYAQASSSSYGDNPIAKAIYGFIYDDDVATSGSYGHRNFCLATGLVDNSGNEGEEGLVGFAITKGRDYSIFFADAYSTIVVMNAFDPSDTWNHSSTIKASFCTEK